eukprot:TRINITY_DN8770_c0_g5_i2.p1 TRINITY_DN8770_c0_g5~~TRINITY_DN8770_c0_g5_i2.p1  ORF type:complete len:172 (+),score=16.87 TRINITY_DN8770_c0_g5_i2:21-536(+)
MWSAGWTHCGRLVSGDDGGKVCVWDLEDTPSPTMLEGHISTVDGIAVSTTRIFTGSKDSTIRVYDISTLTRTDTLSEHTSCVVHIALTNDEQHLVSCSKQSLKVWCTDTLTCTRTVSLGCTYRVAVSQPGDVVAVSLANRTELYNLSTLQCLGQVQHRNPLIPLAPSTPMC